MSLPHFSRFSPSCCFLADMRLAGLNVALQSRAVSSVECHWADILTLCSIMCVLHNSIIIQLCLGRVIVVTAHIKAPNLIQLEHLEIKLRCSTVQVILLFLSEKSVFPTSLQDLLSIHGAAQMEETPCLRKKMVPDDHLKLILFLVI